MKTANSLGHSRANRDIINQDRWFRRGHLRRGETSKKLFKFLPKFTSSYEETKALNCLDSDLESKNPEFISLDRNIITPSSYGTIKTTSTKSSSAGNYYDEDEKPSLKKDTFIKELAFERNAFRMGIGIEDIIAIIVPEKNPFLWTVINGLFLLATIIVTLVLYLGANDNKLYQLAMGQYNEYSLFNTIIWDLEIGLTIWYNVRLNAVDFMMLGELAFAIYYSYDSLRRYAQHDPDSITIKDCYEDMALNFVAYLYTYVECWFLWRTADDLLILEEQFSHDRTNFI